MKYAILFPALGAGVAFLGWLVGGWGPWLALWPTLALAGVGLIYATGSPRAFGKRLDGTQSTLAKIFWAPFLILVRAIHEVERRFSNEPAWHEVAPNLYVGRRPRKSELPSGIALVIDMCAEMPASLGVRDAATYRYFPTLDATAPTASDLARAVAAAREAKGPVLVHCAFGRGRSATVAAGIVLTTGPYETVEAAEAELRKHRPSIRLNDRQRAALRVFERAHPSA